MTFSQIPYHRADLAAWKAQVEDQTLRFRNAQTLRRQMPSSGRQNCLPWTLIPW